GQALLVADRAQCQRSIAEALDCFKTVATLFALILINRHTVFKPPNTVNTSTRSDPHWRCQSNPGNRKGADYTLTARASSPVLPVLPPRASAAAQHLRLPPQSFINSGLRGVFKGFPRTTISNNIFSYTGTGMAASKPTAKKTTAITEKYTKSAILAEIAANTDLSKKQVDAVLNELTNLIERHIRKRGVGEFTLPG